MSLANNFVRNTDFVYGFSFKGKRVSDVGEDLVTVLIDTEESIMDGTPLTITGVDANGNITAEVTTAGTEPDAFLYSRISEELTDAEWMLNTNIMRDEVKPGDPATAILNKKNGIIRTSLADATTLTVGADVEVGDVATEDEFVVADVGEVVGRVIATDGADKVTIILK